MAGFSWRVIFSDHKTYLAIGCNPERSCMILPVWKGDGIIWDRLKIVELDGQLLPVCDLI
jgi:hypothetical protein